MVQDLAIVLDAEIPAERVVAEIRAAGGNLLESVDLFDVYQGPQVPEASAAWPIRSPSVPPTAR